MPGVPRDPLNRPAAPSAACSALKLTSWNVNGLRAVLRNNRHHFERLAKVRRSGGMWAEMKSTSRVCACDERGATI